MSGTLKNIKGTITLPQLGGLKFILNNVNMSGSPDNSQMATFDKKWLRARTEARGWYADPSTFKLGNIKDCMVQSDVWIINMICQDKDKKTDIQALKTCMDKVIKLAKYEQATLHISSEFIKDVPEISETLPKEFEYKGDKASKDILNEALKNNVNVFIYE